MPAKLPAFRWSVQANRAQQQPPRSKPPMLLLAELASHASPCHAQPSERPTWCAAAQSPCTRQPPAPGCGLAGARRRAEARGCGAGAAERGAAQPHAAHRVGPGRGGRGANDGFSKSMAGREHTVGTRRAVPATIRGGVAALLWRPLAAVSALEKTQNLPFSSMPGTPRVSPCLATHSSSGGAETPHACWRRKQQHATGRLLTSLRGSAEASLLRGSGRGRLAVPGLALPGDGGGGA